MIKITKKERINEAIDWLIEFPSQDTKQEEYKKTILEYISFLEENIDFVECFDLLDEEVNKGEEI